jgi:AcrR family transcriptional regulator
MGISERKERARDALRGKILDAARELFVAEGFEAVTMRAIAERIEYSATAVYLCFKDKQELMRELVLEDFGIFAQQFVKLLQVRDPVERLRKAGLAYVRFALAHPNHYRLMFMTPPPPGHKQQLDKGNPERDAYAFLRAAVEEAIAQRLLLRRDVELVTQAAWAAVHGIASLHIAKGDDPFVDWRAAEKTAALLIDSLLSGLK